MLYHIDTLPLPQNELSECTFTILRPVAGCQFLHSIEGFSKQILNPTLHFLGINLNVCVCVCLCICRWRAIVRGLVGHVNVYHQWSVCATLLSRYQFAQFLVCLSVDLTLLSSPLLSIRLLLSFWLNLLKIWTYRRRRALCWTACNWHKSLHLYSDD